MSEINKVESVYRKLTQEGRSIVKIFSGNPAEQGLIFPGEILKAGYEPYFQKMDYAPDPKGDRAARQAIRKYYERHKVNIDPEHILLTSGTSESYLHILSVLTQPGDNILVPHPGYPLFDQIAAMLHVELRPYQLMEDFQWAVDMDTVLEGIDDRTRAIFIVSPHNPTGSVMPEAEVCELVDIANERGLAVVSDEVFSEFVFDGLNFPRVAEVARPELLFTLNGISKMYALPSMKLSWMAVSGEGRRVASVVDALETRVDTFLSCHTGIQRTLPLIFSQGGEFLRQYQLEVERRRNLAVELLHPSEAFSFHPPRGGFYMTIKINDTKLSEEDWVIRLMEQEGIFVHPGYFYDCPGDHLVISFLTKEEILLPALEKIFHFVGSSFS